MSEFRCFLKFLKLVATNVACNAIDECLYSSMLVLFQGYNQAGQTSYAMDSLRWIADYFVKNHHSPLAFTAHIGDVNADHASWGRPEDMTEARPSYDVTPKTPGMAASAHQPTLGLLSFNVHSF